MAPRKHATFAINFCQYDILCGSIFTQQFLFCFVGCVASFSKAPNIEPLVDFQHDICLGGLVQQRSQFSWRACSSSESHCSVQLRGHPWVWHLWTRVRLCGVSLRAEVRNQGGREKAHRSEALHILAARGPHLGHIKAPTYRRAVGDRGHPATGPRPVPPHLAVPYADSVPKSINAVASRSHSVFRFGHQLFIPTPF